MEKIQWKNTGKSTFTTRGGQRVRRGEVFEASEAEVPVAFRDVLVKVAELPPEPAARTFTHRRYAEGTHYDYDDAFEQRLTSSSILNRTGSIKDSIPFQMATVGGLRGLKAELDAQAQRSIDLLKKIDTEFENRKVQARRQGKVEPETMPLDLLEQKYQVEARHDVLLEEMDKIKGLIDIKAAPEKAEEEARVLRYGPCGAGKGKKRIAAGENEPQIGSSEAVGTAAG